MKRNAKTIIALLFLCFTFFVVRPFYQINWGGSDRFVEDMNNKVLSLMEDVPEGESILLLGPHSNYYVFSGSLPSKPWLDNFNWHYELPGVQESTINLFKENPQGMVIIDKGTNYLPTQIVEWVHTNYHLDEIIEGKFEIWRKN